MNINFKAIRRVPFAFGAVAVLAAAVAPALVSSSAAAAGQVQTRSIQMSDSAPGATSPTYKVTFTPATTEQELVIDFCANTPIVTDSCNYSAATTPTTTGMTSSVGTGVSLGTGAHTMKITGLTMTASTPFTLNLTGSGSTTNPTTAGTFYARIYTYATGGTSGVSPATTSGTTGTFTGYVDYGGVALSTAAVVNITAKVMESLSFCVYLSTCGDNPSISLGHGTNTVLDTSAVDTSTAKFSLSSNAKNGIAINLKGDTLKNAGATYSFNTRGSSAAAITAGTENFGVDVSAPGSNVTAVANYVGNGTSTGNYGFNLANVTSTYGDTIANATPVSASVSTMTFAATASAVTPASVYTAAEQLIATGTF